MTLPHTAYLIEIRMTIYSKLNLFTQFNTSLSLSHIFIIFYIYIKLFRLSVQLNYKYEVLNREKDQYLTLVTKILNYY